MKKRSILALLAALALMLSACSHPASDNDPVTTEDSKNTDTTTGTVSTGDSQAASSDLFTDRDFRTEYEDGIAITLSGSSAACDDKSVEISGSTITIKDEGTYVLSGKLDDGMVIVDTDKNTKVQLVLNGADISSETSAPIYILQVDKVFITLAEGSENALSNGGTFTAIDENNIDSVIFSKDDLTLNGSGSLTITSPARHGIVSKDELTITGKDNVCIAGGSFAIVSGKDGIQADNDEDTSLGFLHIQGGTFDIDAEGDGLSASGYLTIDAGTFDIVTGGGSVNATKQTSDNWGGFMGGGHGGKGGGPGSDPFSSTESSDEDSTSIKGIKASGALTITGGTFTMDTADDSIHSNTNVTVGGGTFQIATGDDGFHADENLTITAGTIGISESYEGLEGLDIVISGGEISLVSSDDGINAAGGTDSSGMGGFRGGDMFGGSSSNGSITISGGSIFMNASGDGIDANGSLAISGGTVIVCGPTSGDTAVLDYDTTATITGGTFIGTGASTMAQTFSSSEQGVIALKVGSQSAGTELVLTDASGNEILSYTPNLSYQIAILSSPDMVKGESYTIQIGTATGTFEAS